jgi:hypothetical protein
MAIAAKAEKAEDSRIFGDKKIQLLWESRLREMKVIHEVVCSKCGKKQVRDVEDLLKSDLFWRVCEFCRQYGLQKIIRRKLTLGEWMQALYNTMGFRVVQTEAFLKDVLKKRTSL